MGANLIEQLRQVNDFRTLDGRRHPLWLVLLFVIMGIDDLTGINPQWNGIKSLIRVERMGTPAGKPYHEVVCYISSLIVTAREFACGIRRHWGIENRLHWVKDVVLNEDDSIIHLGNAPANLSIIRAMVLNILHRNGYALITKAQRFLSNDIDKLLHLVE